MGKDSFVHLHVHTDYSKLDGMQTVEEVAQFARQDRQPAVAITDHGNMSGYIKFEQACIAAGVKPIPGLEAYHVDSFERVKQEQDQSRDHMLMLAVSDTGYRNLMQMSSKAYLEQKYYKPLTDDALLAEHAEGIVMTSGCLGSPVNQALLRGDEKRARELLGKYSEMMAPGHYFVEVQVHDFPEQQQVNKLLIPLAQKMNLPLVATQDAHYVASGRADAHEKMLAMQTGALLSNPDRFRFASHTNYMATAEEMRRMVPEDLYPDACDNTLLVAEMASDITRQTGSKYLIPAYPDIGESDTERALLRAKVLEGAKRNYGEHYGEDVAERVDYELDIIHDMGFDAYFLIVWDMIAWAKQQGIYVGPGRGSAAGSIAAYCLGITAIEPIRYGLFFERFLNPGRKEMPDIDIDIERDRRHEVRDYVRDKYGYDHVAYIATQGVFHGRSAIKAAARIYGVPPSVANSVSSTFPQNSPLTIGQMAGDSSALPSKGDADKDAESKEAWEGGSDFRRSLRKNGQQMQEVVSTASGVEGYIQNFGVHAAAVLITPKPLTNYVPLTTETHDDSLAVCGYDKNDVESIGGLKMDLLGLVNLTTIRMCVEQVEANTGKHIDINSIPLDDEKTFALLQRADTAGIFQLGSSGMKELLRRVWPTRFEDLSALVALYRPGPMGTDMHWSYADRKNGRERISVEHEDMLDFTDETFGLIVYQEQLLTLAQKFAGFTAGEADTLRKATGKKDAALLATQETKFKEGMARKEYPQRLADKLWSKIPSFAAYSFNKAHSAAYAMVAYQTAYLKANHPAEYAAACVDTLSDPAAQIQWAKALGVVFDVPDVNESGKSARAFEGRVRLGLAAIKGLGDASVDAIVEERQANGEFASLSDFLVRIVQSKKVNKTSVEALISAGALDSLASSRGLMKESLPTLLEQAKSSVVQETDWDAGGLVGDIAAPEVVLDFDDQAKESMPLSQRIGGQVERLGVFLGTHPMTLFRRHLVEDQIPAASREVSPRARLGDVTVHGAVIATATKKTRRSTMTTVTLESEDGYSLDAKVFGDAGDITEAGLGSLVVVEGVLQEDEWQKATNTEDAEGESPRELLANWWMVVPLSALDDADSGDEDRSGIVIKVNDGATLSAVARALEGQLSPGLRCITVVTPQDRAQLPYMVSESAEFVEGLVTDLPGVSVR
jgi:DNA polymerase-3 subunit alpha